MQVIKETLRLYPAIEGITKKVASGGVTLCGHHIPGGARIMVCAIVRELQCRAVVR